MEIKIRYHNEISLARTDMLPDLPGSHQGGVDGWGCYFLHFISQRTWDMWETGKGTEFCDGIWRAGNINWQTALLVEKKASCCCFWEFPSVGSSNRDEHFLGTTWILCGRASLELFCGFLKNTERWWNFNESECGPLKTGHWLNWVVEGVWEIICIMP